MQSIKSVKSNRESTGSHYVDRTFDSLPTPNRYCHLNGAQQFSLPDTPLQSIQ
jgi:hypothetical protein